MIFITGFAHSGTTFVAEVLYHVGYKFSQQLDHMEDIPLRRFLYDVNASLLQGGRGGNAHRFYPEITRRFEDFGRIDVVKQPALIHSLPVLEGAGVRPNFVLLCSRPMEKIQASLAAYGRYEKRTARSLKVTWMRSEWYRMINFLTDADIPYGVVSFPESVHDRDLIPAAMGVSAEGRQAWYDAWQKARKPERVHYG